MIEVNAQYNVACPESLSVRIAVRARQKMFDAFMEEFAPARDDKVLDLGVTSDRSYRSSNYFEALYPYKENITAAGIDDASFLEAQYPGLKFTCASALALPFSDASFDLVHSSAVLEHVGSLEHQSRMVSECLRVGRRGVCLTTPNRWFPIEFHTVLPLVHWLPKKTSRKLLRKLRYEFFAQEENLNLMSKRELHTIMRNHRTCTYRFAPMRLAGWTTNLVIMIKKT